MIDLTRVGYLGLAHAHAALAPWSRLTPGRPAALGDGAAAHGLADRLARLLGFEAATLAPSTLHVVIDLYAALAHRVDQIFVAACSYPITQWGLERARLRGTRIRPFRHVRELAGAITRGSAIVCDAVCVTCRRITPLAALSRLAARSSGLLIVDDSQGVGLLGREPSPGAPYGRGGGGTLAFTAAPRDRVIAIGSLAKAFGAPLAFLAADRATVRWFERESGTRVHTSPCNAAALSALAAALEANARAGDATRTELADRVATFRAAAGDALCAGMFPIQATRALAPEAARALTAELDHHGVRGVAVRSGRDRSRVAFVISAAHDRRELARAGSIVAASTSDEWRSHAA